MELNMTIFNPEPGVSPWEEYFTVEQARQVLAYHRTLPNAGETPLRRLDALAERLGIAQFYVKDESYRFGLNAFKALGGSYALARALVEKTGKSMQELATIPPNSFTFFTATDGNHGRGVAWAAKNLGQKAVVYMPAGSSQERLEHIRALGAEAEITPYNYDDAVRYAQQQADLRGGVMVQDTAWEGYETIPVWIMQGYMSMAFEAAQQLGDVVPTHIFLQAGVGAMAGGVTAFFSNYYGDKMPRLVIVEPDQADCFFRTASANDGTLHKVEGRMNSIMAGLCCGEVCTVGWEVLKHHAGAFFSCPDHMAADGMRVLGNPLRGDAQVISGESGAATTGLVYNLLTDEALKPLKEQIGLNEHSVVLCISTEGDTDRETYQHIVWDGWYRKPSHTR